MAQRHTNASVEARDSVTHQGGHVASASASGLGGNLNLYQVVTNAMLTPNQRC